MSSHFTEYIDLSATLPDNLWVNPVGGLGDAVMVSTALHTFHKVTGRRLNMVRRTGYSWLFANHPGVAVYGNPPSGAILLTTDYWSRPEYGETSALELIFNIFGLDNTYLPDHLWIPDVTAGDSMTHLLKETAAIGSPPTVIVSPGSDSPRKMPTTDVWRAIVARLKKHGLNVVTTGKAGEPVAEGAYSLAGATLPRQIPALVAEAVAVITPDSFIAHVASAVHTPAVVLFGPTKASTYGYGTNVNLSGDNSTCPHREHCLGPHVPGNYTTECPHSHRCIDTINIDDIVKATLSLINSYDNRKKTT